MLSRVASSIYWLNRYIERAENYARFIEVNLNLTLDLPRGTTEQWEPLVATTGDHESFTDRYGKATKETVIQFLLADAANSNSILSCLLAARENARSVPVEKLPSKWIDRLLTSLPHDTRSSPKNCSDTPS